MLPQLPAEEEREPSRSTDCLPPHSTFSELPAISITYNYNRPPYVRPLQPGVAQQSSSQVAKPSPPPAKHTSVKTRLVDANLFAEDVDENYVFENEDISLEPSIDCLDIRELSVDRSGQDAIWDSGASDNVTGDRYALHDFKTLARPIAVRVATDGPPNYITGTGTLKFCGMNSTIITVKRVYFFRNNFDVINLMTKTGKLHLQSNFDVSTNSWPLLYPPSYAPN
ncbi:hypothetical protein VP01_2845g2 [Puccinia sorghi]|uniref:Uncharacterized protein n=1 Tax=Puccinia sorghi TaxID=27349 RepID=A0A0L6V243_9BASI|nr:hypothetical protein VP01_2845g2 [Puccinia sorghi]